MWGQEEVQEGGGLCILMAVHVAAAWAEIDTTL